MKFKWEKGVSAGCYMWILSDDSTFMRLTLGTIITERDGSSRYSAQPAQGGNEYFDTLEEAKLYLEEQATPIPKPSRNKERP